MRLQIVIILNDNYDDDYDDENDINDNNGNTDHNHHNDHNDDDNDSNFDNDNGYQTIWIFQAIHLGELFACEKTEFCKRKHILMCDPLPYVQGRIEIFEKS